MNTSLTTIGNLTRKLVLGIWAVIIVTAVAFYIAMPEEFTASKIAGILQTFQTQIWLVYLGISAVRGFTLLPSTPLVLAGTLLYPDQPWLVLSISMAGILISSSLIYFCSEALGFTHYFETKRPAAVARVRRRLENPAGLAFVALWSFFPFAPTDAVCYVAGSIRMAFPKFIMAVFLGELLLCSIYVFLGSEFSAIAR